MSAHTPGPWSAQIKTGYAYVVAKGAAGGVASVHHIRDASLVAAAPDLLAALQEYVNNDLLTQTKGRMNAKARAAIAKATEAA